MSRSTPSPLAPVVRVSFIIPAWNEAAVLGETLDVLATATTQLELPHEVIVVDDDSSDTTAQIARERGAWVVAVANRQIAATRNAGARAATGDLFIFIDADTLVSASVVQAAIRAVHAGAVGGGCGLRFGGRIPTWGRVVERATVAFCRTARLACGCFVFCRRDMFEAVGGFETDLYAAEEWAISVALKRLGPFVMLREEVVTSGRKLRAYSPFELFRQFASIAVRPRALLQRDRMHLWYSRREDRA